MREYIDKQVKIHENNLKYDFLPSMIEIIERPANKLGTTIMFVIIGMIITTIIWASIFKLDVAVTGMGVATPEGGMFPIECEVAGKVTSVKVKNGAQVKKGDVLATIDSQAINLSLQQREYELQVLELQKKLYTKAYDKLKGNGKSIANIDVDPNTYGEYKSVAIGIVLEYNTIRDNLKDLKGKEILKYKKEQTLSIVNTINQIKLNISSTKTEIKNLNNELIKYNIVAIQDGIVTQIDELDLGRIVAIGDTVGYVIPKDKENIFHAYITDENIVGLKEKSKVQVKIAAYDDTEDEYISGTIKNISDATISLENVGSVYVVEIKLDRSIKDMKVGMEGTCDIIIGKRTVLDYFLEPFKDGLKDSMKEK